MASYLDYVMRQIRGMAMIRRGVVPNLVLSQHAIDKMYTAARKFIADETGEAMVGFILPGDADGGAPTRYVIDTISPDESAIRQMHTFQQGDALQDELIYWLQENWHVARERGIDTAGRPIAPKFQVPLRYMGDWHKQPGFMIAPSGGDLNTALAWLDDPETGMDFLLVPIVTLGHPDTVDLLDTAVNYVLVDMGDGTYMRVDWWYIHRDVGRFQAINPAVIATDQVPALARYPWHVIHEDRYNIEANLMADEGLFATLLFWETDPKGPLSVCFLTARQGAQKVLLLTTHWDFPKSPPTARVAPFGHIDSEASDMYEVFGKLWEESEPVADPPGWTWTPEKHLLDYIHAIEDHLGIRPKVAPAAAAGQGGGTKPAATKDDPVEKSAERAAVSRLKDPADSEETSAPEEDKA